MSARVAFTLLLLLFVGTLLVAAGSLTPHARLVPLVAAVPTLLLLLVQLARDLRSRPPVDAGEQRHGRAIALAAAAGLALTLAVWLLGAAPALAAGTGLYLRAAARLRASAAALGAGTAFLFVAAIDSLVRPLPSGVLVWW